MKLFRGLKKRAKKSRQDKEAALIEDDRDPEEDIVDPEEESDCGRERANRSVNDFVSSGDLRQALLSDTNKGSFHDTVETGCLLSNRVLLQDLVLGDSVEAENHQMKDVDQKLDWVLENYDKQTTKPQSLDQELRRLLVLKSFLVLDTERRESFEKVTEMASQMFHCPISLISLVDLGRQWFLSNRGLGELRETNRKLSFCAHAIESKNDCLVVLDLTQDDRFKDNPFVTAPDGVRFYAGAPLISPEGYKLGTLCVVDRKARSLFTDQDKSTLIDLAAMAVQALVHHKKMKTAWFKNLEKTCFPEFEKLKDDATVSSSEQVSDADASGGEEMYQEDRDVAAFLKKTKNMTLASFLSILEDQARELNLSPEYLKKYEALTEELKPAARHRKKKVRFVKDRKVRYEVHNVESLKPIKGLWWSPEEMHDIQTKAFKTTLFYRQHKPQFTQSVEIVAKNKEPRKVVEAHMMQILVDGKARGLESQISSLLSGNRQVTVKAVLQEQSECRKTGHSCDVMDRLRGQSLAHSQLSTTFAEKTAFCDHIDALKATMSQWRPKPASQLPSNCARVAYGQSLTRSGWVAHNTVFAKRWSQLDLFP